MADAIKMLIIPLHLAGQSLEIAPRAIAIRENLKPSYNAETVYGRMDPIAIYKGTQRSISFNFELVNTSPNVPGQPDPVAPLVNKLATFVYPQYTAAGAQTAILKSPPFFTIAYGSWVGAFGDDAETSANATGLAGYIDSLTIDLGGGSTISENLAANLAGQASRLIAYKIDFNFTVVHQMPPGWAMSGGSLKFGAGTKFIVNTGDAPGTEASTSAPTNPGAAPNSAEAQVQTAEGDGVLGTFLSGIRVGADTATGGAQ
tara:strand:- start:633 stop:1409 length:777 start_codon:yes stop_codon:yes gene_type:complete